MPNLRPTRLILSLAVCLIALRAVAQEAPAQLVSRTIDKAFAVLRDERLRGDAKQRMRELRQVVDGAFDWETMARSSLGAPWRNLNDRERGEFVSVFKELLAQRYMDDIDRFEGREQMKVTGSDQQAELATVKTVLLTSSRQQLPIDYTLHKGPSGWRVEDVTIEGVSLVNHYRKTFARYLTNKSFQDLMRQLKTKLGPNDKPKPELP